MGNFWKTTGGAAAISGISGAASGLFGGLFAAGQQRRQYKYNKLLQEQQQAWQERMWNLENLYQLPKNEVQRLLDAGINPALAFGNAGGSAAPVPVSGSAGGVSSPTADFGNPGAAAVQAALNVESVEAEVDLKESLANKADQEAAAASEQAGLTRSYKDFNELLRGVAEQNRDFLVNSPRLSYNMQQIEFNLLRNRETRDTIYTGYYPTELQQGLELTRWNIKSARRNVDLLDANVSLLQSEKRLTDEQARSIRLQAMTIEADAIIGQIRAGAVRSLRRTGIRGRNGELLTTFFDAVRAQVSDDLQAGVFRSNMDKLNAGLDRSSVLAYGKQYRDLSFNLYQQQHTLNRSQIWRNGAEIVFGAFGNVMNRYQLGPKTDMYRAITQSYYDKHSLFLGGHYSRPVNFKFNFRTK